MAADKNLESYAGEDGTVISNRVIAPDDWTQTSDVLKFSNCTNVVVDGCTIEGGKEDCIDAVRGSNYTFNNTVLAPRKNGITIKGSVNGYSINEVSFVTSGSDCDIEFGSC
jgi:polygalacturonase